MHPVKTVTYPQRFCSRTSGDRRSRGNWLTQVRLESCC